ncbi:MAG: hypothetical protein IPO66_14625 [Rhodanobacteraceae bacterium]|nr:hypothetical protein [Rhodanobacteraceae bacterium]
MTEASSPLRRNGLAWGWALLVLTCALHLIAVWTRDELPLDTDVMALLPQDTRNPAAERALARLSEGAAQRVVVVLAASDFAAAAGAAKRVDAELSAPGSPLTAVVGGAGANDLIDFYAPWRDRLLAPSDRERLARRPRNRSPGPRCRACFGPAGPRARSARWTIRWAATRRGSPNASQRRNCARARAGCGSRSMG